MHNRIESPDTVWTRHGDSLGQNCRLTICKRARAKALKLPPLALARPQKLPRDRYRRLDGIRTATHLTWEWIHSCIHCIAERGKTESFTDQHPCPAGGVAVLRRAYRSSTPVRHQTPKYPFPVSQRRVMQIKTLFLLSCPANEQDRLRLRLLADMGLREK